MVEASWQFAFAEFQNNAGKAKAPVHRPHDCGQNREQQLFTSAANL